MKLSLRLRFFAAIALVIVAVVGAFSYGLQQFFGVLEYELLNHTLTSELQEFADGYARDPALAPPSSADLRGYVDRDDAPATALPEPARGLGPGVHDNVFIDGREFHVGRADVGGARLYLLMDVQRVESLEERLVGFAVLGAVGALMLAALAAVVLGRFVLQPVTELADTVAALAPQQRGVRLHGSVAGFGDRELSQIAAAMDRYLERIDHYIEREQAFTEDASHELRTALATMLSGAQLLVEQPDLSEQARERLTRISRAGQQMQSTIEALLFLAREDGGGPERDCALDELVREAAGALASLAAERGIAIEVTAEPVVRRVAPGMAASVVNNLLLNAVQHSGASCIHVDLDARGFTVRDNGPGIAPAELPRLFERRYRGSQSTGLGIGLYLVKRICDRLGWPVEVTTPPAGGAAFAIRFGGPALTKN